tara:strand:+ start:222 stop:437 length:216 start_codon:yes stop_codon:yes gene_type:complete
MENIEENISMNIDENKTDSVSKSNPTSLNVNILLLNNMKSLLEISTQRGAFKANELSSVGKIYDELVELLK